MHRLLLLSLLIATVALTGCPKRDAVKDTTPTQTQDSASSEGAGDGGLQEGQQVDDGLMGGSLASRTIYFDLDSAEIRSDSIDIVNTHARSLAGRPTAKVRLEGHADERGSREYNIGLGERRAQAVRRALMLQGAGDQQIATVSYGEERPAINGSDESSWSKNRRVEIVYGN